MDVRLRIAVASERVDVSALCREVGISRQTFYVWRRRYVEFGLEGLEPRSSAPKTCPGRIGSELEDAIVELRKELSELGVDAGPATIQWHLGRRGYRVVPSQATVWRTLVRRGFVVPEPRKRPKSAYRRFEASAPNELWQADVTEWVIVTGPVKILSFLDDHSRVALRVRAVLEATSEVTWHTFCEAAEVWGVPLGQLTDNGPNFSGKLHGFEVHFERQLRAAGVVPKTSRPYHPQTCGKVERFQQTLKKWLRRPPLTDLAGLQAQLDAFVHYYNHERPHRAIGRMTPAERWAATPPAINLGIALPSPAHATTVVVGDNGVVGLGGRYNIAIGKQWRRRHATIHHDGHHAAVFIDHRLVRALQLDPTRRYQPSGLPRGGRPKPLA